MADNRFPSPGVDARFPSPGVDLRFLSLGIDAEFPELGVDTRFQGSIYGAVSGPVITSFGSLSGTTFTEGVERVITQGNANPRGGGAVSYSFQWLVAGAVVSTNPAYTPLTAQIGQSIAAQWRATETGGTTPGSTGWVTVGSGTVAAAPFDERWAFSGSVVAAVSQPAWGFSGSTITSLPGGA